MSDNNSADKKLEFKKPTVFPAFSHNTVSYNATPGCSTEHNYGKSLYSSKKVPYTPPEWSRIAPEGTNYAIEIMKSGVIVKKVKLIEQAFFVFGRFLICEIYMAHPTVSRYHAIIQYKGTDGVEQPPGWYIYDFGSSHGTYLNKKQIASKKYIRMRVGDQLEFGASSRTYILVGPEFDLQDEPNLTVAEIKIKAEELKLKKEMKLKLRAQRINNSMEVHNLDDENSQPDQISQNDTEKEKEAELLRKQKEDEELLQKQKEKKDEDGIDWGMGDDSEPEPDLADNPYASTTNEELYIQDPKKTLRGFFSREGADLNYDCEERGPGQFSCRVQLPVDDTQGRPVIAEAIHRGKKKEAVVACALEACRILDRMGVLRQAKHESRRRKQRDWDADDYYDSEDDTFFDRTGNVEKKRQARMEKLGVVTSQSQSYDDLTKKIKKLQADIQEQTESIKRVHKEIVQHTRYTESVDDFLKSTDPIPNYCQANEHKEKISKCKLKIKELQTELAETNRLAQLARPTDLAQLTKKTSSIPIKKTNLVVYGKRMRLRDDSIKKTSTTTNVNQDKTKESEDFVIEVDSDEEEAVPSTSTAMPTKGKQSSNSPKTCEKNTDTSTNTQKGKNRTSNTQIDKKKNTNTETEETKVTDKNKIINTETDKSKVTDKNKITNTETDKSKVTDKNKITNTLTDKIKIASKKTDKNKIKNTKIGKNKKTRTQTAKNKIKNIQTEKNRSVHTQTDNIKIVYPQADKNKIKNTPPAQKIETKGKKMYGPARPPANYVIPDSYYDEANDRDLPEITEKSDI